MAQPDANAASYGATPLSLLERARALQPEAWKQVLTLYRPLVFYWCGRKGVSGEDAEDVSQEVLSAAASGLAGFRRDRPEDTFRGWLRGITRNLCLLHFRRTREHVRAGGGDAGDVLLNVEDPTPNPDAEEEVEVGQLYHRALELVRSEFEPATWDMFWRTVIEDRDTTALATELGVTPAAVRQAKSRVLRRIKEEVGDLI
ncbi:MAG: RNA polymerase sigma factor [Gemmataceae bacterium]